MYLDKRKDGDPDNADSYYGDGWYYSTTWYYIKWAIVAAIVNAQLHHLALYTH